jgi:hypothetical protein
MNRHKAIDLRLQKLGARSSTFTQAKMPMAHRKGIAACAREREARRRREARENGIILEKPARPSNRMPRNRDRSIDQPAVGKFRGGVLRLSKHDIAGIKGPGKRPAR